MLFQREKSEKPLERTTGHYSSEPTGDNYNGYILKTMKYHGMTLKTTNSISAWIL